ncbi:ABC transporter ATP-binding protein [Cyclobacterium sp. 1_MG-2023]|uniref:ABC transporter ATP-binding protein n=1 Tax=Cyclobacterium sp. 1_MG-2023 TaxID=3062681 RepID=UPI0026E41DA1|nr:ABC transporter ATP-binding protein [Cyclobacterium sp. 1_MG-2023]MDO6439156.1 ABC transporter ATP-binding protein [Cyclobacterium sp. 1_MG-2023]
MNILKTFIKKYFYYFSYFYQIVRGRLFIAFGLSMLVALMDGLGLTMFLPLLEMVDGGDASGEGMGKLGFILDGMGSLGIPITVSAILLIMAFFFILKGVLKFFEQYYSVLVRRFFVKKMRLSIVDLFEGYSFKNFIKQDSGRIQNTATGEIERILIAFNSYMYVLQAFSMIFIYVAMAFSVNVRFSLFVMIGGVLSNFLYSAIYKRTKRHSVDVSKGNHYFQSLLIQKIANFKYLKASGLLTTYGNKLRSQINAIEYHYRKLGLFSSIITAIREPIIIIIIVAVILFEVNITGGSISGIILSLLFFYRSLTYLLALQAYWNSVMANYGSLENIKEFSKELKEGSESHGNTKVKGFHNEIRLDKVSFGYGEKRILDSISFSVFKNQAIAIVGESGSGKSTLMNIMAGLFLPDTGAITIDGNDMKEIDRNHFQKKIGYITQEPVIFDDTIFNNVSFWDKDTIENRKKCKEALSKASVLAFIETLDNKEDSRLGNNGIMVSGGQKQRISIARELYKGIDVLLMDEATSALDSETEFGIQENIDKLKGQITIIIIAHRLSTIKNVDRILLLKGGKIQASGDFEELEKNSSAFKKMVALQAF